MSGKKQYDHLIKLIIIGDSSVGKSCMLLRFSEDNFPTSHMPTIGKQSKQWPFSYLIQEIQNKGMLSLLRFPSRNCFFYADVNFFD